MLRLASLLYQKQYEAKKQHLTFRLEVMLKYNFLNSSILFIIGHCEIFSGSLCVL